MPGKIAPRRIGRLAAASVLAVGLAILLLFQALSAVYMRTGPELAVSLFPANGLAREQFAFGKFLALVEKAGGQPAAAKLALTDAKKALGSEALAPKAYVIMALAQEDRVQKRELLDLAYRINRRDLALLGLVLQERLAEEDYPGTVEVLDQLLRVHPEYSQEFFPALLAALTQPSTEPLFADMLDGSAPWHERFLSYAVARKEALPSLARLRPSLDIADSQFDQRLISGIVQAGDTGDARALLKTIGGQAGSTQADGVLDWSTDFPPLDWRLVDEAGFRAVVVDGAAGLDISVRPGKGGLIADRIVNAPRPPFLIRVTHSSTLPGQLKDIRLQLQCLGADTPFFEQRLSQQANGFKIGAVPQECGEIILGLNARAWSGSSALSSRIEKIQIVKP